MTSRESADSESALVPLLVGKESCNITFILDSSETMRADLRSVKRLLIQTLLTKASLRNSLFNLMTFSNKVNCWSHHMLSCSPDTVYAALSWIHSISCSPGRNLQAALSLALGDPACHCVHLIITALPDQQESVLRALSTLAAGRPVNTFFLEDSAAQLDLNTRNYLQRLTLATRGSCYVITNSLSGKLGKVIPLYVAEIQSSVPIFSPVQCSCPSISVLIPQHQHSCSPALRCSLDSLVRPLTSCMRSGPRSLEFVPGSRVLARREVDGLYYPGSVIQPVQGPTGVWVVEFDHPGGADLGMLSSQREVVCSLDMVNHNIRHQTSCLLPGDAVLSPWEPNLRRYGPGRVMVARLGFGVNRVKTLQVLMWNSCTSLVPDHLVLPVSSFHYDRIVREIQIRSSAQSHYFSTCYTPHYTPRLFCNDCSLSASSCCSFPATNPCTCTRPPSCRSSLGERFGSEMLEQNRHRDSKDAEVDKSDPEELFSSTPSSLIEDETNGTFTAAEKLSREQQRPPWRYWRRTGPEPHHRQPGSASPRRTFQPVRFSFPVPQMSGSPNHSSMFLRLPATAGKRTSHFKPRPPVRQQTLSANNVRTVYT